jgi:hypothetical protein
MNRDAEASELSNLIPCGVPRPETSSFMRFDPIIGNIAAIGLIAYAAPAQRKKHSRRNMPLN